MVEFGKIDKPEASTFTSKRKLYMIPVLPFEELVSKYGIDIAKVERFWGEVREKIDYFITTYGKISILFIEGLDDEEKKGIEHFEKLGKESNHFKLIKTLIEEGAVVKGIDRVSQIDRSRLLIEEYSKSFLPQVQEFHKDYYGKDINFEGWRDYLIKKIKELQDEMEKTTTGIIQELPSDSNGVLIITDGRPIEFPEDMDVFQIRPPAFDEIERKIREKAK